MLRDCIRSIAVPSSSFAFTCSSSSSSSFRSFSSSCFSSSCHSFPRLGVVLLRGKREIEGEQLERVAAIDSLRVEEALFRCGGGLRAGLEGGEGGLRESRGASTSSPSRPVKPVEYSVSTYKFPESSIINSYPYKSSNSNVHNNSMPSTIKNTTFHSFPSSYIVITDGVVQPAIVLGVSNKLQEVLQTKDVKQPDVNVNIVRRFSGGGAVVIDENSLLCGLILSKWDIARTKRANLFVAKTDESAACAATTTGPEVGNNNANHISATEHATDGNGTIKFFPKLVMQWTEELYRRALKDAGASDMAVKSFRVRENDYVFDDEKFGGNAQSFSSDRCCHHTSFLWDYDDDRMRMLSNPKKQPDYRRFRSHESFVCRLKDYLPSRTLLIESILKSAQDDGFRLEHVSQAQLDVIMSQKHQQTTKEIIISQADVT